jgi:RimJ/RimL family protein N-acetyltransferase
MPASRKGAVAFVLRELRWEDFPSRRDGYFALYDEVKENPELGLTLMAERPSEEGEAGWFSDLYRAALRGDTVVVVGEMDGKAVGMATIAPARFGGRASENAHVGILGILVDRPYRGRGLGEALLVRALELARARFERVRLAVFSVNVRAKRLYERLGFRTVGHLEGEVKRGGRYLDEELMTLHLADWRPPAATPRP